MENSQRGDREKKRKERKERKGESKCFLSK